MHAASAPAAGKTPVANDSPGGLVTWKRNALPSGAASGRSRNARRWLIAILMGEPMTAGLPARHRPSSASSSIRASPRRLTSSATCASPGDTACAACE